MVFRRTTRATGVFAKYGEASRKRAPFVAGMIVVSTAAFIAASIAIASVTSVPEVARSSGEIVPTGDFVQIEAPEGGTVLSVSAREGDVVVAGQVLASLASPDLSRQMLAAEAEIESLNAQISNHTFILRSLEEGSTSSVMEVAADHPLDYAISSLRVLRAKQDADLEAITRLRQEVASQTRALERLVERRTDRAEQVQDIESLFDKGLTTKAQVVANKEALSDVDDQIHALELGVSANQKEIALLWSKRSQDELAVLEKHVEALFQAEQRKALIETDLDSMRVRQNALEIVASRDGHVHSVGFPNKGELVERGETLFEIMPSGEALVAVLRIPTRDIGHISVGKNVKLQLETFDARETPHLAGRIRSISPNRVYDRDLGEDYFRAVVELDDASPGYVELRDRLSAGMALTAEIVTRERSMLAYVLKPIERSMSLAFNER